MSSETTPYLSPAVFFAWNLGGPVTDFDCGIADMAEHPTDGGCIVVPLFQEGSALGGLRSSAPGLASSVPDMFESPQMDLSEPHRGADVDLDDEGLGTDEGLGLRPTTTNGVLEPGGSTNRADRKPAVKTHTGINTKSKAVGHEAAMLMTPSAHGGGDKRVHMPSVQQESTAMTTQEGLPSVEGGMKGAVPGPSDSIELRATKNDLFHIHNRLKQDYRLFLDATSEDFERGTLPMLKCKLCHGTNFKTWDHFTRHCKSAEPHPLELFFCDDCGDSFARSDSLERHSNGRASECRNVAHHEAEAKRIETITIHREFLNNTRAYLKTNQGTWTPFAQLIKERFPNSSKRLKGSNRQQSRLQAPESR